MHEVLGLRAWQNQAARRGMKATLKTASCPNFINTHLDIYPDRCVLQKSGRCCPHSCLHLDLKPAYTHIQMCTEFFQELGDRAIIEPSLRLCAFGSYEPLLKRGASH